jgi:putative FmdB family regulatory protein
MPTYEYVCEKCGHEFEVFQKMSEPSLKTCPKEVCRQKRWAKGAVKRKLGAGAGLIFKGSGFYITDYRSAGYKDAAKKDATPAATPAAGSGEKKPAAAPAKSEPKKASGAEAK